LTRTDCFPQPGCFLHPALSMTALMLALLFACIVQDSCVMLTRIRKFGMLMPDNESGPKESPTSPKGSKRPHPWAVKEMRQATRAAFSDGSFLAHLSAAMQDRDDRLSAEMERAQTGKNLSLSGPPAPTTTQSLLSTSQLEVPKDVLPHEEASFHAFVIRAEAWLKNAGVEGKLTPEAAWKGWLQAAEAARQRVIADGGRVEDHPHLQRFWSTRDSGTNGAVKPDLDKDKYACNKSCSSDLDFCGQCVLSDPHHVFGDIDNIEIPMSQAGMIPCWACSKILEFGTKHAEMVKDNKSEEQRKRSKAIYEHLVSEYA